jgi:uncharacterized membrane protein YciS (DUF1049 family)
MQKRWKSWCIDGRKMLPSFIVHGVYSVPFFAGAIYCGIKFFKTDQSQFQLMYAAFFVCCILIGYLIKVFGWVMFTRNSLKREIKRLELRIAELDETVKNK